ncbi:MAG: heavy-metal-associated domain-containing protein [Sarcina sp.]
MNIKMEMSNLNSQDDVVKIQSGLANQDGVLAVEIKLEGKTVNVVYDDFYTTQYVVMDIIEELGYGIVNISGKLK